MIHFAGYGVIADKTARRSIRPNFSVHPVGIATFSEGKFHHHTKFGDDRTTRAGCRCEKCLFFSVTLRVRRDLRSRGNKHYVVVYGSILILFSYFSEAIALSLH